MKKALAALLALILIAGALFGVCYWIGHNAQTSFSVKFDGEEVTDEIGGIGVSTGEPLQLVVTGAYTCTVVPREGVKLAFREGDKTRNMSEFADVTAGFRITKDGDKLTVTPVGGLSSVISAVTGKEATVGNYDDAADLFTLLVRSEDGKQTRKIHFGLYRYEVDGVKLSDKEIRF